MRFGRIMLVCGLTLAMLGVSNVSSYSLEQAPPVKYAATADRCLALLDVNRRAGETTVPIIRTSAVARQTALGLMLGVRSIAGPREAYGERQKLAGVDSDRARAVARYRHCRSRQTLESLASN